MAQLCHRLVYPQGVDKFASEEACHLRSSRWATT